MSQSIFKDTRLINNISTLSSDGKDNYLVVEFGSYSLWDVKTSPEVTKFEFQMLYNSLGSVDELEEQNEIQERGFFDVNRIFVSSKTNQKRYYIEDKIHQVRSRSKPCQIILKSKTPTDWQKYTQMTSLTKYNINRTILELDENTSLVLEEKTSTKETSYHVSVVLSINKKVNLGLLESNSSKIELDLHGTIFGYDLSEYRATVKIFNSLGSSGDLGLPHSFDVSIVEQPRYLNSDDLVKDGIIEGPGSPYAVTYMVSGSRRFLIIHLKAVWLVDPYNNWVKKITGRLSLPVENVFDQLDGLIIDGILVSKDQLKLENPYRANDILYVYDILNAKKSKFLERPLIATFDVNQKPAPQRYDTKLLNKLNMLFEALFRPKKLRYKFKITTLDHIILSKKRNRDIGGRSLGTFCLAIYEMLQKRKEKVMDIIGLLFRPVSKSYGTVMVPDRDRKLTKTPETCKWIEGKIKLRLRLEITNEEEDFIYTYYGLPKEDKDVVFEGTEEYPFYSDTMIDYDHPLFKEEIDLDGKVIEFYWDKTDNKLIPDKIMWGVSPDSLFTIKSSWSYMHDPLTTETMVGSNNMYFSYQQKRLKKHILKMGSGNTLKPHLLDFNVLTSSIRLWDKYYGNVIGLVPNPNNLNKIVKEINNIYGYDPIILKSFDKEKISKIRSDNQRVILIVTNSSNTQLITNITKEYLDDKVDVIVSFYETEQWWKTSARYRGAINTVINTLIPGGKFIYLVFNSENLDEQYKTKLTTMEIDGEKFYTEKTNMIQFNVDVFPEVVPWYGPWRKGRTKVITVPKIRLDRLVIDLEKFEFQRLGDKRSDSENLLHPKSYLLASLFNYGVFQKLTSASRSITTPPTKKLKKAYVFLLMKGDSYLPGILAVAQSLKLNGSTIDRVCMITKNDKKLGSITMKTRNTIIRSGLFTKIVNIDYIDTISIPLTGHSAKQYGWMAQSYTKWQCLNFTEYDKLIFLDADLIILSNIDHLFDIQAPAGTFSYVRKKEFANQKEIPDINKAFPRGHNAEVSAHLVRTGVILPSTFTASLVVLEPSKEKYKEFIELLEDMKSNPNRVVARGERYNLEGELVEEDVTLLEMAGTDERSLAYLYSGPGKNKSWRNIHPRYNLAIRKANWVVKPGTHDPETEKERYYSPSVIHYIQSAKPWSTDRMKNNQDFITIKFWYYVFTTIFADGKIKLSDFKTGNKLLINNERYDEIDKLLKLSPDKRKNRFRYTYNPKIHSYTDPWAANLDFDPFKLKWKTEKPKRKSEWTFDPGTVFILTNNNYVRAFNQPAPGKGYDEIIPYDRQKEFVELSKIPNWRYKLWAVTARGGFPKSGENKRILVLTKNATLVSERNSETERFRIPPDYWNIMNNRHTLSKKKFKPTGGYIQKAPRLSGEAKTKNTNTKKEPSIYKAMGTPKRASIKRSPRKVPPKRSPRKVPPKKASIKRSPRKVPPKRASIKRAPPKRSPRKVPRKVSPKRTKRITRSYRKKKL